eukprot:jgi/Pico_ML_1/51730/g296.t1
MAAITASIQAVATPKVAIKADARKSVKAIASVKPATAAKVVLSNNVEADSMQVWQPYDNKKFETLSYLPDLSEADMAKQIDYLIRMGWIPCIEISDQCGVFRVNNRSPGYYDGRYWTMYKLPMYGCTDSSQVLEEINNAKKEFPQCFVRVLGFDNIRQVQCASFIVHKP